MFQMKIHRNEKGLTLIELLATIVVMGMLAILSYQVIFQGFSNYERIKVETELRDEADYIMASLLKEVFSYQESKIELISEESSRNFYFENEVETDPDIEKTETGFKNGEIIIADKPLNLSSPHIKLDNTSEIIHQESNQYNIEIVLGYKGKKMTFKNTIRTIEDEG